MNKKIFLISCLAFLLGSGKLFAQNTVNVNPVTGAANVVIPVYDFSFGQLSFPINLVYAGNGVKVKDVESTAGMGWDIQMGGKISRVLKGLPDDGTQDISGATRLGWMSTANTAQAAIVGFNIANSGSGNCTNETSDVSYINNNFPITMDTEPDLFYVSAPGLSCELVYDNVSKQFKPVSYQDIKISYTYSSNPTSISNSAITSFTITNDKGITYVFATPEIAAMQTVGSSPSYFRTKYQQYQNTIDYYDGWCLSSMTDANGNEISLVYSYGSARNSDDPVSLYLNSSTTAIFQYHVYQTVIPPLLTSLLTTVDQDVITRRLSFAWTSKLSTSGGTSQSHISTIAGLGKTLNFGYGDVVYLKSDGTEYHRQFLTNFSDGGNPSSPVNYSFSYYNVNANMVTTLPDSSSAQVDYWGYYAAGSNTSILPKVWVNPSNGAYQRYQVYQATSGGSNYAYTVGGNSMTVDPANVMAGSLQTITYAQGGTTTLLYEPNDYLDAQSGVVNQGGGIRVKQLTNYDGISPANNQVINYSYLAPNGLSSGKPISLPAFAFTVPYSGTNTGQNLWNSATALSTTDLSEEDHTIMYSYVKRSQTGAGVTQYQYYVPATNWDASATPGCSGCTTPEWAPVIDLTARTNCSSTYGPVKNDIYSYPFIPNTNYDFERGLLQKVTNYLDNGTTEVSEDNYTYQRSYAPSVITAFRCDDNGLPTSLSEKVYNKYNVYYNTSELTTTDSKKVFDSQNYTQAQTSSVSYVYGSPNHKLPTQTSVTNSDNSIYTTNIIYTKDYTSIGAGTNATVNALYNLQTLNVNTPVETYQTVTRSGVTTITRGSLTLFSGFSGEGIEGPSFMNLPSQKFAFVEPDGIPLTSFTPYAATGSGSSQSSVYDTRYYYPIANYSAYDYSGDPLTMDDANHHVVTTVTDNLTFKPVAVFKNAAYAEVAFSDFDSQLYSPETQFSISGTGTLATTGGHAGNGWNLGTSQVISVQVTRSSFTQNYIFSAWINAPVGTQSLNISVNGAAATTYTYTGTGQATYYEWKLGAGAGATFAISVSSPQAIIVDDLLLYPENSEVSTASYDQVSYFKTSQTNTNGISNYYTNDQWGRVLFAYDQDKNIVVKNTYITPASYNWFSPYFSYSPSAIVPGTQATFSGFSGDSGNGETFSWNFGDGTTFNGGASSTTTHTYTTAGSKSVQLTVVSPYFGTKTYTQAINVAPPAPCKVTYTNNTVGGSISSVSFTNSSGVVTTLTNLQMEAGTASIPPGSYGFIISVSGAKYTANNGKGYSSVDVTYGGNSLCEPYTGSNLSGNVTVSSGWTLNFLIQTAVCPPIIPQ